MSLFWQTRYLQVVEAEARRWQADGQYRMLTRYVGRVDGSTMRNAVVNIYDDERLLFTQNLNAQDLPIPISIFVEGVRLLRVEIVHAPTSAHDVMSYAIVAFVE